MGELLSEPAVSWTEIEGWLTMAEGRVLQSLAMGKRVLELGSWKGRSAICMAEVAGFVLCLDHFRGDRNTGYAAVDLEREFETNLERCGVKSRVDWFVGAMGDVNIVGRSFDLVYVDVEHSYIATLDALDIAKECVKPGGVIAWHDADCAEVRAAVAAVGLVAKSHAGSLEWCTV